MVNKQQNHTKKTYESSSFPILGVLGTLLIATGVLCAVSMFIGVESACSQKTAKGDYGKRGQCPAHPVFASRSSAECKNTGSGFAQTCACGRKRTAKTGDP